jgi:hypothetical protein
MLVATDWADFYRATRMPIPWRATLDELSYGEVGVLS